MSHAWFITYDLNQIRRDRRELDRERCERRRVVEAVARAPVGRVFGGGRVAGETVAVRIADGNKPVGGLPFLFGLFSQVNDGDVRHKQRGKSVHNIYIILY